MFVCWKSTPSGLKMATSQKTNLKSHSLPQELMKPTYSYSNYAKNLWNFMDLILIALYLSKKYYFIVKILKSKKRGENVKKFKRYMVESGRFPMKKKLDLVSLYCPKQYKKKTPTTPNHVRWTQHFKFQFKANYSNWTSIRLFFSITKIQMVKQKVHYNNNNK